MSETVIVDYGMANLRSVQKAFEQVGHSAAITGDPKRVAAGRETRAARRRCLPRRHRAVARDRTRRRRSRAHRFPAAVPRHLPRACRCSSRATTKTACTTGLGIFRRRRGSLPGCTGTESAAHGLEHAPPRRGPGARCSPGSPPSQRSTSSTRISRVPTAPEVVAAEADYPTPFCSAVWQDNVFATQFHPEKSQRVGLQMLRNFGTLEPAPTDATGTIASRTPGARDMDARSALAFSGENR